MDVRRTDVKDTLILYATSLIDCPDRQNPLPVKQQAKGREMAGRLREISLTDELPFFQILQNRNSPL